MTAKRQRIPVKASKAITSNRTGMQHTQPGSVRQPKTMKQRPIAKRPNAASPIINQPAKPMMANQAVKNKSQTKTGGSCKAAYDKGYDEGFNEGYAKGLEDGALDS